MSVILEKNKKYNKQKIKKITNLKKNHKYSQEKQNVYSNSTYSKPPRQKSFIVNNKERNKNTKSNNINYTTDMDDMNYLLSSGNDPFSRSVVFSNNKRIANNFFPPKKKNKYNDISLKKNQKLKLVHNKPKKIYDNSKNKISSRSVLNTYLKTDISKNKKNNLNKSEDYLSGEIISKFEENFQLIEDKIIDKNYENNIAHDEMIISTNKNKNINLNALFNKIHISNTNTNRNFMENDDISFFFKDIKNEEYDINNNFENNKADFCIMYIDNYDKMINDDMLLLELQLLFEKILDLQNAYHEEYKSIIYQFNKNKKFMSFIIQKCKEFQKKIFILSKIEEKTRSKNKLNLFLNTQEKEHKSYITEINNKEKNLWMNMVGNKNKKNKVIIDSKKEMKDLFKKIVFNKYSNVKNYMNGVENKIVLNLMKKYNYKVSSDKKVNNNKNHIFNTINCNNSNGKRNKKEKMIRPKIKNHKIINSADIYENNLNNKKHNSKNNKFNSLNYYFLNSTKLKGY